jgi:SOS-response transcriptional repressor LexA
MDKEFVRENFIKAVEKLQEVGMIRDDKDFAEQIGAKQPNISAMLNRNRWVSSNTLISMFNKFPVNKDFIYDGNGNILNTHESNAVIKKQNSRIMAVPLISQYAQAGYLSGYADPEYLEHQPIEIVEADYTPGNYVAFEVKGDSMEDGTREAIYAGDIVIGRELYREHWKSKFRRNEIYIIVHRKDGIVIKEIVGQDVEKGIITLHSKNPEYHDYPVCLDDVLQIFYKKELRRK